MSGMKKIVYAEERFSSKENKSKKEEQKEKHKMNRKNAKNYIDLQTLLAYTVIAMVFSIGLIVLAAIITRSDIGAWNNTALVSAFFIMTGSICGFFILRR